MQTGRMQILVDVQQTEDCLLREGNNESAEHEETTADVPEPQQLCQL